MVELSPHDRAMIAEHTAQLRRYNDLRDEGEVLVSCTEAARLLGKTKQTISEWIAQGRLHKRTFGKSTGIQLKEIRQIQNPM